MSVSFSEISFPLTCSRKTGDFANWVPILKSENMTLLVESCMVRVHQFSWRTLRIFLPSWSFASRPVKPMKRQSKSSESRPFFQACAGLCFPVVLNLTKFVAKKQNSDRRHCFCLSQFIQERANTWSLILNLIWMLVFRNNLNGKDLLQFALPRVITWFYFSFTITGAVRRLAS